MQSTERISTKLGKFAPSLTLALKSVVRHRRAEGLPVYDFGLGETRGELHPAIRAAGEKAFREGRTMYADPAGTPELRRAVIDWLGLADHYGPENVVITTGAKQALFNVFLATCNPADCVLFDAAPWVSYQPLAVAAYAFPVAVLPLEGHSNYLKVSPADLERNLAARPHTRLFLLNNPCNPTGQLYSAAEVESLLRVCCRYGVYMVLDRLYWRIVYEAGGYPEPPIDDETRPWLLQVDGMSKNFRSTGGMRIGWSVGPDDVTKAMINLQSHYTSGPAVPDQAAAVAALTHDYDPEMVHDLRRKRDLLRLHAEGMPHVEIWPTPASFYSFWNVAGCLGKRTPSGETIAGADDVSRYLLEEAGVVTASGRAFLQEGFLRLSFTTSDEDIVQGMAAAHEALGRLI
ncbi:MAG: aminotransferase class I/II-fold pyridoxal phosphate-dependent enzyme [Phycisphaeraceae bacterium]|nr:MAG: aminotransferase class I/II-fold pyridoxal phosphate-dependent enzyme [Phycisphaeraceae bacterium]